MRHIIFIRKVAALTLAISFAFLASLLTSTTTFAEPKNIISQKWVDEELCEKRKILEAFWQNRIMRYNEKSVNDFRSSIIISHFPKDPVWEMNIKKTFEDAVAKKINFNLFFDSLKDQPLSIIESMNNVEKLISQDQFKEIHPRLTKLNLRNLEEYIREKQFSASITLGAKNAKLVTPAFPENQSNDTFAMHSVGKVFTGILIFIMIRENIISESDLSNPVQLDETVTQQLPAPVREQLKKVTLYQLMTHKAGLGDYLTNYCLAISQGKIPTIKQAEDFIPFVDKNTFPIGEFKYSNAGILLVGLAIKHAYEKKFQHPISYDEILQKYIIEEVGMPSFTPWRPKNGKFNLSDPIAPFIVGSPAGGYWVTAEDLAKFGQWVYKRSRTDSTFKKLIEKYGQEFYYADSQSIVHIGAIPSSMAFLSVSLKTGAVFSFVSNQPPPQASDLKVMIQRHIFFKKI